MTPHRETLLGALSSLLWRERQLLELLLYKLVVEQMVLRSGDGRWVASATREVELVLEQVQVAELGREVELVGLTHELALGHDVTLRSIIAVVDEPWDEIFSKHRDAFLDLTSEISDTAASNRALASRAHAATRATLAWVQGRGPASDGYTSTGAAAGRPTGSSMRNWAG